jgi:hypothetical protein
MQLGPPIHRLEIDRRYLLALTVRHPDNIERQDLAWRAVRSRLERAP